MAAARPATQRSVGFSRQVECLRRRLTDWGWPTDEIAAAIGTQFRLRPRAAYRYAAGLSGQKAADAYNARFGTAERSAPMNKTRISEYENWPIGSNTRKPSLTILDNLAQLYGTTRRRLTDHHDWAALPDTVRRALRIGPETGMSLAHAQPVTRAIVGGMSCRPTAAWRSSTPFVGVSAGAWTVRAERHLIMDAANQAGDHAGRSSAGNIEEPTLEQLHDHVARLARSYLTGPMLPLFGELVAIRNRAYELLELTQRLSQRSDLYLIVGQLSCLLAGTSCDLGYPQAAIEQARAACTYGDLIGHNSLWAYAHGQLAMFFSLEGQLRRSLRHARLGLQRAAPGSPTLRLRSLEALSCSRLALAGEANEALFAADRARGEACGDDAIHDRTGGMFTSTPAKHAYLAAMTHIHLGHADDAAREASTAIDLWTTGPPEECAGSALAVARIDLVTAHLLRGELDGAEHAARPLLAVAPEQRTTIVLKRLERYLSGGRYVGSAEAERLGTQLEDFRATSTLHRLPPG